MLRTLGLGDALARVTYYPQGRDYRAWDTADRLYDTPLGERAEARFGAPYYTAHRADLLDVLLGGLGREGFHLGSRIERFEQDADRVTITLADGSTATGDILIGADGIHSTVRGQMFGKELPRYTGNVAWRGLVPAERVAHLDVADVTGVWMGPNRSIVQYYVAAGRTFNWIGISRSEQPARESWLAEGRVEDALAEYSGWHDTIRTIIKETPKLLRQALYDREPLPDWQIGRVVLVGRCRPPDDAVLCAGRGAEHRGSPMCSPDVSRRVQDDPVAALTRYVKLRLPRTAWMQGLRAPGGGSLPDERRRHDRASAMRACGPTGRLSQPDFPPRAGAALRL